VNIRTIVAVPAAVGVLMAALTIQAGQPSEPKRTTVRRVEPFTRPVGRRLPSDGGSQPVCPDSLDLCRKFQAMSAHFVQNYRIPLREKELLILRTAYLSRAQYQWGRHYNTGRRAGLTDEDIARIVEGPDAAGWTPFEAVLLRAADEMHTSRFISEPTWKALAERYSDQYLLEIVLIVGNYTMLAIYQNTIGMPLEPGLRVMPE
jgi:alkylhydroperoxidase family enzyme